MQISDIYPTPKQDTPLEEESFSLKDVAFPFFKKHKGWILPVLFLSGAYFAWMKWGSVVKNTFGLFFGSTSCPDCVLKEREISLLKSKELLGGPFWEKLFPKVSKDLHVPAQYPPFLHKADAISKGLISLVCLQVLAAPLLSKLFGWNVSFEKPTPIDLHDPIRNLTQMAKTNQFSSFVGREKEIDQLFAALSSADKPNAILVGPPGSGKTAVVEQFALKLAKEDRDPFRQWKVIWVNAGELIAGTSFVGTFEEKIMHLIEDAKKDPHLILFIDEIHLLMWAGRNKGQAPATDLLKPSLARGDIRIIGCTTSHEYEQILEDGAFCRRFQKIEIQEPTGELLIKIIHSMAQRFADIHQCIYDAAAIKAAIDGTRAKPGHNPDKAATVLDRVGSYVKMNGRNHVMAEDVKIFLSTG